VNVTLGADADDAITIEVCDDGPGIPPALRDQVFEPFFKADDARRQDDSGFGLGLSIAQEIIKRHGGSIALRPAQPTGLRVMIALPSETSPRTHLNAAPGSPDARRGAAAIRA
jgi:signal transduction histidine kinase